MQILWDLNADSNQTILDSYWWLKYVVFPKEFGWVIEIQKIRPKFKSLFFSLPRQHLWIWIQICDSNNVFFQRIRTRIISPPRIDQIHKSNHPPPFLFPVTIRIFYENLYCWENFVKLFKLILLLGKV